MRKSNVIHVSEIVETRTDPLGVSCVKVRRGVLEEWYITCFPLPGEAVDNFIARVAEFLLCRGLVPVLVFFFAPEEYRGKCVNLFDQKFEKGFGPIIWCEAPNGEKSLFGTQVVAVSGVDVSIASFGRTRCAIFEIGSAQHCFIGEVVPWSIEVSQADQAKSVLEGLFDVLRRIGHTDRDLVRTWFYLEDIHEWYSDFNSVRNEEYRRRYGETVEWLPASTGVGCGNAWRAALVGVGRTIKGHEVGIREVASPLQCAAVRYGSAFSRALEISEPDLNRLLVSGTASIGADGLSLHAGDIQRQIETTMNVVRAILESREMGFRNVVRAIAYFARADHMRDFKVWCQANWSAPTTPLLVCADICRSELVFEIELDAVKPRSKI